MGLQGMENLPCSPATAHGNPTQGHICQGATQWAYAHPCSSHRFIPYGCIQHCPSAAGGCIRGCHADTLGPFHPTQLPSTTGATGGCTRGITPADSSSSPPPSFQSPAFLLEFLPSIRPPPSFIINLPDGAVQFVMSPFPCNLDQSRQFPGPVP